MTDYVQEQEMEIEALEAILMDEFKEIHSGESGLNTSKRCFQIALSSQDDYADESTIPPVQLALIFSHTEKYPDEPPLLNVKSLRGIQADDLKILKEKLEQEASENLGMAMVYTLVTSAKEWLAESYIQDADNGNTGEAEVEKDVIVPHGEPVTVETFLAWRERFEAELALERAKLMPESALAAPKEKKLTGRQWFESGRASAIPYGDKKLYQFNRFWSDKTTSLLYGRALSQKGTAAVHEVSDNEDDEDVDFDDDDFEDDEEDMLEHYLAEKSDLSIQFSRQAN